MSEEIPVILSQSAIVAPVVSQAKSHHWNIIWVLLSAFFVCVATILGTGILALPVKLEKSGFMPFLTTFTVGLVAQALTLIFMIELLQKTQAIQDEHEATPPSEIQLEEETTSESTIVRPPVVSKSRFLSEGPDLHTMGNLFLNKVFLIVFDLCILIHFVSIMISYALAGPTAYGQFIFILWKNQLSLYILIPPFVIILALIVIFGANFIGQVISILTLFKGSMLVVMISVVGFVGFQVNHAYDDNWIFAGRSFLVGTVALGGAVNTLPLIYSKMSPTARNIGLFRFVSVLALFVCWLLNVLWCWFILRIVPQSIDPANPNAPTLERSSQLGEPSTVPLISILNTGKGNFGWIGYLVAVFIMVSITVSFMAMSSGLKHMLDGWIKSFNSWTSKPNSYGHSIVRRCGSISVWLQFSMYVFFFALVLILALLNPKSFLVILEVFTSLALNMESGFFIAWMVWTSKRYYKQSIPLPLPNWFVYLTIWFCGGYFLFACIWDVAYHVTSLFVDPMPF